MITTEILNSISDNFSSTFTLIDPRTITNLLSGDDRLIIEQLMKKNIKNINVEFLKTGQLSNHPKIKDIWIIKLHPQKQHVKFRHGETSPGGSSLELRSRRESLGLKSFYEISSCAKRKKQSRKI